MNSRRHFLKQLASASALIGTASFPFEAFAKNDVVKITILHTNDVHSHIEPFPENDFKYPGMGGIARRMALIDYIRNTEKNVLLFDAGDIFQGTPYFNMFNGELEMKLMSKMQYDAGTIGNHDFDNGVDGLSSQLIHANFPLLNCNYDFSGTSMAGKTKPYQIFEKENIRIGVFGLGIELKGLVDSKLYGATKYLDPLENAAVISHKLKHEEKCDLIICLSHLGYKYEDTKLSDTILAKKSLNIDLIIGGHTHTFLDTPYQINNRDNKKVLIAQVGWAGLKLGKVDFYMAKGKEKKLALANAINIDGKIFG